MYPGPGQGDARCVRVVPSECLRLFVDPATRQRFEKEFGAVSDNDQEALLYLFSLATSLTAMKRPPRRLRAPVSLAALRGVLAQCLPTINSSHGMPSPAAISTAFAKMVGTLKAGIPGMEISQQSKAERLAWCKRMYEEGQQFLCASMNRGLEQARFVIWWMELQGKLAPGLYCQDAASALFALASLRLGSPGGLGVCIRCSSPFLTRRGKQAYCSYRCQTQAAMARYRERKKRQAGRTQRKRDKSVGGRKEK